MSAVIAVWAALLLVSDVQTLSSVGWQTVDVTDCIQGILHADWGRGETWVRFGSGVGSGLCCMGGPLLESGEHSARLRGARVKAKTSIRTRAKADDWEVGIQVLG